jgi:hypothetical protein
MTSVRVNNECDGGLLVGWGSDNDLLGGSDDPVIIESLEGASEIATASGMLEQTIDLTWSCRSVYN